MALKIKTNAGARLTAALATGENEVSVSSADVGRFPTLTDVGTAADVSDTHVAAGTAKDYFHAVVQYETIADADRRNERAGWREYVRVWNVAADRLHIVRDITGETNTHDGNWDIEEGDVVTITETLLATDLPVLAGQLRGVFAGGDNVELGTAASRVGQVRAKNADFSVQAMVGDRVLKAGTGQVDPASPTLFLPKPEGSTDAKNTLATRGDNLIEGCLTGSLCIVREEGEVDNYDFVGGEFGDAVNITKWITTATEHRVKFVSQSKAYIDAIFGDHTNAGDDETQTTLAINSVTHVVRHVVFENPEETNGPFVTMECEIPLAVTLEAFREHIATLSVNDFAKTGSLTANNVYVDEAVINNVAGLAASFQFLTAAQRFFLPTRQLRPTVDDDEDAGAKVGELWFSSEGQSVHICLSNTNGEASWGRFVLDFLTKDTLFDGSIAGSAQTITLSDAITDYSTLEFNGQLVDRADFVSGTVITVGNKTFTYVAANQIRVTVTIQTDVYYTDERVHRGKGEYDTVRRRNTRDVTSRGVNIKGLR